MIVYRIAARERVRDLQGTGAKLFGGRWNPKGYPVIYTSANASLAILEKLVHLNLDLFPANLCIAEIHIEEGVKIETIGLKELENGWNSYPSPDFLKNAGKEWIRRGKSLVMSVPSAINPLEHNYLINPEHPDMKKVNVGKIHPLQLDHRLKKEINLPG